MKKGGIRMEQLFYTSDDIAQMLGVSKSKAYAIIRSLNLCHGLASVCCKMKLEEWFLC